MEFFDLGLLLVREPKLLGNLGATQCPRTVKLQTQLTEPGRLLCAKHLGNLLVGQAVGLLDLLARLGESLITLFLTQFHHLAEVAERRPYLVLRRALQVGQITLLFLTEPQFRLDLRNCQQHQVGDPARPKTGASKSHSAEPRTARPKKAWTSRSTWAAESRATKSGTTTVARWARWTKFIRPSSGRCRCRSFFANRWRCGFFRLIRGFGNRIRTSLDLCRILYGHDPRG